MLFKYAWNIFFSCEAESSFLSAWFKGLFDFWKCQSVDLIRMTPCGGIPDTYNWGGQTKTMLEGSHPIWPGKASGSPMKGWRMWPIRRTSELLTWTRISSRAWMDISCKTAHTTLLHLLYTLEWGSIGGNWSVSVLLGSSLVPPLALRHEFPLVMKPQLFEEVTNRYTALPLWVVPVKMKLKTVAGTSKGPSPTGLPQLGISYLNQSCSNSSDLIGRA